MIYNNFDATEEDFVSNLKYKISELDSEIRELEDQANNPLILSKMKELFPEEFI